MPEFDMQVVSKGYRKPAGKPAKFSITLKDGEGNSITLVGDSKALYEGFPENTYFQVKVAKIQAVLAKTLETRVEPE